MSHKNREQMKKLIEAKKKKGRLQESVDFTSNKVNGTSSKGFKNTKKAGSLNK